MTIFQLLILLLICLTLTPWAIGLRWIKEKQDLRFYTFATRWVMIFLASVGEPFLAGGFVCLNTLFEAELLEHLELVTWAKSAVSRLKRLGLVAIGVGIGCILQHLFPTSWLSDVVRYLSTAEFIRVAVEWYGFSILLRLIILGAGGLLRQAISKLWTGLLEAVASKVPAFGGHFADPSQPTEVFVPEPGRSYSLFAEDAASCDSQPEPESYFARIEASIPARVDA